MRPAGLFIYECTPDASSPNGKVYVLCLLFNRPCTFTRLAEIPRLWGGKPNLSPTNEFCFISFWATSLFGISPYQKSGRSASTRASRNSSKTLSKTAPRLRCECRHEDRCRNGGLGYEFYPEG